MAPCRTLVRQGGWMVEGMYDRETGERLVIIEAEGTYTRSEVERFVAVVKATAEEGPEDG